MCLLNLNNLPNKLSSVSILAKDNNIDILAVTETWLLPSISDASLTIKGFHSIARTDTLGNTYPVGSDYDTICMYFASLRNLGAHSISIL